MTSLDFKLDKWRAFVAKDKLHPLGQEVMNDVVFLSPDLMSYSFNDPLPPIDTDAMKHQLEEALELYEKEQEARRKEEEFVSSVFNSDCHLSSASSSCSSIGGEPLSCDSQPLPLPLEDEAYTRLRLIEAKTKILEAAVAPENLFFVINLVDINYGITRALENIVIPIKALNHSLLERILRFDREEKPAYQSDVTELIGKFARLGGSCLEPNMIAVDFSNLYYYYCGAQLQANDKQSFN